MPSGRTHDRITLWSLPLVLLVAVRITLDPWLTGLVGGGYLFGGFMFGPDLDIHSVQYKRWGWFRWIWLPYRGSLRHRSRLSHGPIIGTTLRVLYLSLWLGLLGVMIIDVLNSVGRTQLSWGEIGQGMTLGLRQFAPQWLALICGIELGALSHSLSDWLVSSWRRQRRGRRSRR